MQHSTYASIVGAITRGRLNEPFSSRDWKAVCPEVPDGSCNAFLNKHRKGNPGKNSELFLRVAPGQFKCLRPFGSAMSVQDKSQPVAGASTGYRLAGKQKEN